MRFIFNEKTNFLQPTIHKNNQSKQISKIPGASLSPLPLHSTFPFNKKLQASLQGKQLLLDELPFSLNEIQEHYLNGYLSYQKGIQLSTGKRKCNRCSNINQALFASYHCARCQEICYYCRNCIKMGRVSECTPLISWTGPTIQPKTEAVQLHWEGELSPGQQMASDHIKEAMVNKTESLVWAVCGAGKTEVLFNGIEWALRQNQRVCIATPRTDVVLELAPRLQEVFPSIPVLPIYGGSEDRHLYSPLIISTTHQLFRFCEAFDVIILDEMDAFPYSVDKTLQESVQKARKSQSALIYLTATPNKSWQRKCRQKKISYVTIPARFHRHPLPVPTFTWCGNWEKQLKKQKLPTSLLQWIKERLQTDKQLLLFVPKIIYLEPVKKIIQTFEPSCETVHSADPYRKEKVQRMRKKEGRLLITTTILERGVTFANIDVAVIGAENSIFTSSALVQIAGRVGRKMDYPTGDITFFHYGKTEAMLDARRQIRNSNKEARKKGMLIE